MLNQRILLSGRSDELRTYKYLTEDEVKRYRKMNKERIKLEKDKFFKSLFKYNIPLNQIKIDEPFHVNNGDWDGFVYYENGKYIMSILVIGANVEDHIKTVDITKDYLKGVESGLDITYLLEEAKYDEFYKIYTDKTTYLNSADENCDHEIVGGDNYSGIKCSKCSGWYCA